MSISALRTAISNAGGTPTRYDRIYLLRDLITTWGGSPSSYDDIALLRQAITVKGGTPTRYERVALLRQLVTALGGSPATYDADALEVQMAALSGATNLLTFASQFDDATWTKSDLTVTADADSPADKLIPNVNAVRHFAYQGHGQSGTKAFTVRADFKAAGLNFAALGLTNTGGVWSLVQFNLATGAVVNTGSAGGLALGTGNIIDLGGGYYRCVATWAAVDLSSGIGAAFLATGGGDPVFEGLVGNGVNGVLAKNALAAVGVFTNGG